MRKKWNPRGDCATWKAGTFTLLFLFGALLTFPFALFSSPADSVPSSHVEQETVSAHGEHGGHGDDLSGVLLGHVMDSDEWEIVPGVLSLHLPTGITVHFIMVWIVVALVAGLFIWGARKSDVKVKGVANVLELLILFVRNDIVYPIMGETRGAKWLPFFITLFTFLLVTNYLGLIPLFRTATSNFNVTSSLAMIILFVLIGSGMVQLGFFRFFKNMCPSGAPLPIGILICFLEFVGIFLKALVLSLRLFANMIAGHLVILALLSMIFVLSPWFSSISVPLAVFVYGLEMLVALIQAVVFTLLSCIFISMACTEH